MGFLPICFLKKTRIMDEESDIVSDQLQSNAPRLVYNRLSFSAFKDKFKNSKIMQLKFSFCMIRL